MTARADPAAADATAPPGVAPTGLVAEVRGLFVDLGGLMQDRVELLSLELRRFGRTLAAVVVLGAAALVLAATAWVAAWAALAALAVGLGLALPVAIAGVALVNIAAAAGMALAARYRLSRLGLPATRRHLGPAPIGDPHAAPH